MTTNAKVGIAVGALVGLVFAVTIISQLPKGDAGTVGGPGGGGGPDEAPKEGLQQFVNFMRYEGNGGRAEYRDYQQYFETGEHTVPFLVRNPNPVTVSVTFASTSCTACSLAEFAILPPLPFDPEGEPDPFGAVIGGVMGQPATGGDDPPFGLNLLGNDLRKKLEAGIPPGDWQRLKPPESTRDDVAGVKPAVEIPPGTPEKPVWVLVRLNIKVSSAKTLDTVFNCQRADGGPPIPMRLSAVVVPVEPCNVYPSVIDFKTIPEGVQVLEETVYFWSATRGFATSADGLLGPLPPPDVASVKAKHLSFTPPVPATPAEIAALGPKVALDPKAPPMRVAAAYKTTLRWSRTAQTDGKPQEVDLGPFERSVGLTPDGGGLTLTKTPTITVKAVVQGAVRLAPGPNVKDDKIDFGSFSARYDLVREVRLTSDTPGVELEAMPDLSAPKFLKLDPDIKVERKNDRTYWTITLRIDKDVGGGEMQPGSGVVVRIKGSGQLVRLPVVGRGTS